MCGYHCLVHSLFNTENTFYFFSMQSAYNKDEFFDTISSNSLNRGVRNGQNRFSERIKLDTEVCQLVCIISIFEK